MAGYSRAIMTQEIGALMTDRYQSSSRASVASTRSVRHRTACGYDPKHETNHSARYKVFLGRFMLFIDARLCTGLAAIVMPSAHQCQRHAQVHTKLHRGATDLRAISGHFSA